MIDITDKVTTQKTQKLKKKFLLIRMFLMQLKKYHFKRWLCTVWCKSSAIQTAKVTTCRYYIKINLTFVDINFSIKRVYKYLLK